MPMQTSKVPERFRGAMSCSRFERLSRPLRLIRLNANASPHLLRSRYRRKCERCSPVALRGTSPFPFSSFAQLATGWQPNVGSVLTSGQGKSARDPVCNPYVQARSRGWARSGRGAPCSGIVPEGPPWRVGAPPGPRWAGVWPATGGVGKAGLGTRHRSREGRRPRRGGSYRPVTVLRSGEESVSRFAGALVAERGELEGGALQEPLLEVVRRQRLRQVVALDQVATRRRPAWRT